MRTIESDQPYLYHSLATELQRLNKNKLRLDIKPLSHKGWRNKNND
jgi:hypothetical protein